MAASTATTDETMQIPEPNRASLTGYVQPGKLLPWRWVDARMTSARNYWITTQSASFPSSRPVWAIWQSPRLWFSTGSAIGRNLRRDPRVQVNLESGDEVVVIEGVASGLAQKDAAEWARCYLSKYNWEVPATAEDVWQVTPRRVLAWLCDSSGLDDGAGFSNSATEWRFP